MIRNIVFDMGEVMYRFYPSDALAAYARKDRETLHRAIYAHPDWRCFDHGDFDEEEMIRRALTRVPDRLREDAVRFVKWYELTGPVDGMEELAEELCRAGHPLYLLSNTSEAFHRFRERIPALRFFSGEFISADHHLLKPDRAIFERFCAVFCLKAEECLFIDDYPPNIRGAEESGLAGIVFDGGAKKLRRQLAERGLLPGEEGGRTE